MLEIYDIGEMTNHPISPLYSAGFNEARSRFIKNIEYAGGKVISGAKMSFTPKSVYFENLKSALQLQDSLNKVVDENWVELGREWYRAIWVECAELMDHVGWKWWKKQTVNWEQAHLELVDIFHFGLSDLIVTMGQSDEVIDKIALAIENAYLIHGANKPTSQLEAIEGYTQSILNTKRFDMFNFAYLCAVFNLSFIDLYAQYVGKNVLNKFRQDNGYKEGTYKKAWAGLDDNEHLVCVIKSIDPSFSSDYSSDIYRQLEYLYTTDCALEPK